MPKFSNPYERKYVETRIRSIEFDISLVGNIHGLVEKYSYNKNTNPESDYSSIYNTGYFYITEEILKEFNILFETKFPLHQFFLEKEILTNLILNLPKLRQRLYFKSSSQTINAHNEKETRLLELFNKNSLDDSTLIVDQSDDANSLSNFKTIRNTIFKNNLDLIKKLFFSPNAPFYIENVHFYISNNPPPKLQDKFENLNVSNNSRIRRNESHTKTDCINLESLIVGRNKNITNTQLLRAIVARETGRDEFNITKILSGYSTENSSDEARLIFRTLQEQEARGNYRTSEAIAKEIIKKIKSLAYRCDIKLEDIQYVEGDGIHIKKRPGNYYKDLILVIAIIPYDERFSFRLKSYCTNTKKQLSNDICNKLVNDGKDIKKISLCLNGNSSNQNIFSGHVNYKVFIREFKERHNKKRKNNKNNIIGGKRRKSTRRKSTRRKSTRRKSTRRKSTRRKSQYKY